MRGTPRYLTGKTPGWNWRQFLMATPMLSSTPERKTELFLRFMIRPDVRAKESSAPLINSTEAKSAWQKTIRSSANAR
jgi:hypothetical protein